MITSTLTADRPRGKVQRERWYQTHTRQNEQPYAIILPAGTLAKHHGAVAVAEDPAVLVALETKFRNPDAPRWGVARWTFEEGTAVTRLTLPDVERML